MEKIKIEPRKLGNGKYLRVKHPETGKPIDGSIEVTSSADIKRLIRVGDLVVLTKRTKSVTAKKKQGDK